MTFGRTCDRMPQSPPHHLIEEGVQGMSRTRPVASRWRRLLPLAVVALAFLGLTLAFAPETPAQGKKPDPKAKASKDAKKEYKEDAEKKEEPRPEPVIPKIVDVMDSTRGGIEQVTFINQQIVKGWKGNKVQPAERCTDATFIRRATLDLIGRIPTHAELHRFYNDPPERRRSVLIDRLIDSEDFAQNIANLWTILLMTRTGSQEAYRDQMHDWLMRKFEGKDGAPDWSKIATEIIAGSGDTNKNQAVNFVLTHLGEEMKDNPAQNGKFDMVPVTSRTTRLFLGIRTQCVQCHDHPFHDSLGQHHFWGINAFFRQVDTNGRPNMMMKQPKGVVGMQNFSVKDNSLFNTKGIVPYERRNAVLLYTDPTFLDGRKIKKDDSRTRRETLADFIVKSPDFSKAFVNRMWGHFFGKSFTKDGVDDFGDHNPVSHPELLDKLAEDWAKKYNHNPKVLARWICNSQAYGLKTTANKYNEKPEDEVFFARMLLKPMTPEQLFESLMTACESKVAKNKEELRTKKKAWLDKLIVNFGNDEGEEGSFSGTVVQALILMNGADINAEIMGKEGTVAAALREKGANHETVMRYLFRSALARDPSGAEMKSLLSNKMRLLPRVPQGKQNNPEAWEEYYQDVFWALLNSNEFILNH
jgi:hypothetical protein